MKTKLIHAGLFGLAVGDALGVPVEFKRRNVLKQNPVTDMLAFGTHHQPKGTWSDDSSLAFCLADSLSRGYDLQDLANRFVLWRNAELWTPHGKVFDIGIQTRKSINTLEAILKANDIDAFRFLKYEADEYTNGNGALMRILPLLFYIKGWPIEKQFKIIWDVSALTHGHIRSAIACLIYLKLTEYILEGMSIDEGYMKLQKTILLFLENQNISVKEMVLFDRILKSDISKLEESDIKSDGYVLHSLEASLWCVLTSNSYKETVLKAVNLGDDTDTTGAIAGGIAGMIYGLDGIPQPWLDCLVRRNAINDLCDRFEQSVLMT